MTMIEPTRSKYELDMAVLFGCLFAVSVERRDAKDWSQGFKYAGKREHLSILLPASPPGYLAALADGCS